VRSRRLRSAALGALGLLALSTLYYFVSVHAFAGNSDGATVVLEGAAVRDGHLALAHWRLSLDSFWTVDVLFYALAVLVGGVRAAAMHLVPAVLAAATVLLGTLLVVRGQPRRAAFAALFTVAALLVLPGHALAFFLLQGPWHVGTVLYCLGAMALLDGRPPGWRWCLAVALLAGALLGDLQALALGVLPVALGGLAAAARTNSLRRGAASLAAAPAAVALALVVRLLAEALGTFQLAPSRRGTTLAQLRADPGLLGNWLAAFVGVHRGAIGGPKVSPLLELPHLLGLLAIAAGVLGAAVALVRGIGRAGAAPAAERDWRLDDQLLFGLLGGVAVFCELTESASPSYARYLDAVVLFGAFLAARLVGRLVLGAPRPLLAVGVLLGALSLATSAAVTAVDLSARPPRSASAALERFLLAHHLTEGIGDYWAASVVTVDTGGAVRLRPVLADGAGRLVADGRQSSADWYRGQSFSFLVYAKQPFGGIVPAAIARTFGAPSHTYRVAGYSVDTWPHALRLGNETAS